MLIVSVAFGVGIANAGHDDGLVGFWDMEGDAFDSSGHSRDGSTRGAAAFVQGKVGQALSVQGGFDGIVVPESASLDFASDHTISFWINFQDGAVGDYRQILARNNSVPFHSRVPGIWTCPSTVSIHWKFTPGNVGPDCIGPGGEGTEFQLNNWYHIAGVKQGGVFKMYIDGEPVGGDYAVPTDFGQGDGPFYIGASIWRSMTGLIDEVRVYDRELSLCEVRALGPIPCGMPFAMGSNSNGQLGTGTGANSNLPVTVSGLDGFASVAAGDNHSLALKDDGTVWAWGLNTEGQLGIGSTAGTNIPVEISGLNQVVAISAGPGHSLAALADGTVWAWGRNGDGQLGIGTRGGFEDSPVQVLDAAGFLTGVISVAGGAAHSMALKSDGSVWAWGQNGPGQLGLGLFGPRVLKASQVLNETGTAPLANIVSIGAGFKHSLAVGSDGTPWAWGENFYGQLGHITFGSGTNANLPVKVVNLTGVTVVAMEGGSNHTLALTSDGRLFAWGDNSAGKLGNGAAGNWSVPTLVVDISEVESMSAGVSHSLAIQKDGTAWGWGFGGNGQLGNGANSFSNLRPVQVKILGNVSAVSAGNNHSLALEAVIPVSSCGTLAAPGTYELTRSFVASGFNCLVITANDVTLDGMGHTITLPNQTSGVVASAVTGLVIRDLKIKGSAVITADPIKFHSGTGISLTNNADGAEISGNTVSNTGFAIYVSGSDIVVHGNTVDNNRSGITASGGQRISIIGNIVSSNWSEGIRFNVDDSLIEGNTSDSNGNGGGNGVGIFYLGSRNTVKGNTISNNTWRAITFGTLNGQPPSTNVFYNNNFIDNASDGGISIGTGTGGSIGDSVISPTGEGGTSGAEIVAVPTAISMAFATTHFSALITTTRCP